MPRYKSFHDYWFALSADQRAAFARRAEVSEGYIERLAGGFGLPSVPVLARLMRESKLPFRSFTSAYEERYGPLA